MPIYRITKTFPKDEIYGLVSQMRRCTVSIASNIAEGFCRFSLKEKIKFHVVSLRSVAELQNQLIILKDVKFIDVKSFENIVLLTEKVHKIINGLIRSSKKRIT